MFTIELVQFIAFYILASVIIRFAAIKLKDTSLGSALAFVA